MPEYCCATELLSPCIMRNTRAAMFIAHIAANMYMYLRHEKRNCMTQRLRTDLESSVLGPACIRSQNKNRTCFIQVALKSDKFTGTAPCNNFSPHQADCPKCGLTLCFFFWKREKQLPPNSRVKFEVKAYTPRVLVQSYPIFFVLVIVPMNFHDT